jgi:uncharacterized oxidoreductase
MKLEGKRILITGGGSGIGLELARRLAGANEVAIAGRDLAKLERVRAETPALVPVRLDVTSLEDASGAVDWVASEFGGLDLLVNNAGVFGGRFDGPDAEAESVADVEINLLGPIRLTRLVLPLLDASPEAGVVFMSSGVAVGAAPGFAVYSATKAAVHSLARSLRAEFAERRIRVFEVLPPVVATDFALDLDVPKVPPSAVVDAVLQGLAADREEIAVGRIKLLLPLARLSPRLADRLVQRALGVR